MGPDPIEEAEQKLSDALETLRRNKPTDRSEEARRWAVTITEMEKVIAYFREYVVRPDSELRAQHAHD